VRSIGSLDLVAQYQSRRGDVAGYCSFLQTLVAGHGAGISALQVGEEPSVTGNPTLDGYYPAVTDAVVAGVSAAKEEARRWAAVTGGTAQQCLRSRRGH
jgi:hypothetical protein